MSEARTDPFLSDFTDADGCYARVAWRLGTAARFWATRRFIFLSPRRAAKRRAAAAAAEQV